MDVARVVADHHGTPFLNFAVGQAASKNPAEEIYHAAASNNVAHLNKIIGALQASGRLTPDTFKWPDTDGRTALHLAAAKNFHHVARRLLECGADARYVNLKPGAHGGTALHEATRNRHEAMAELLLSYGANPFLCNLAGRSCMDEAVLEGAVNLLRRFEQLATWRGAVSVKTSKLGGFSQPYKVRYMVAVPHIPCASGQQPARNQLWVYKDMSALVPKSRVWLDGATVQRTSPNDIVLRLHPSHKLPPGDLAARYDRGYCINLRIADATTTSATVLMHLEQLIARGAIPTVAPSQGYPVMPSLGSFSSTTSNAPSLMPTPVGSGGGGSGALVPRTPPVPTPPHRHAAADVGHVLPPVNTAHGGTTNAVMATAYGSSTGMQVSDAFVEGMRALPGESDSDFASRLASAISAHTGQDQRVIQQRSGTTTPPAVQPTGMPPVPQGAVPAWNSHPLPTPASTAPATPLSAVDFLPESPSAPPLTTMPSSSSGGETAEERLCVICLSGPREAGYLHGSSVHMCVCRECCSHVAPGAPCPLCRQKIERVINIF